MSSQSTSDFRRRRKLNLIKVCGNKCNICGYNKNVGALEFHHLNPNDKKYGIAEQGTCHNLEHDLDEVKKCILVCANCHREIHSGMYSEQELKNYQIFNEDIAKELLQQRNDVLFGKEYKCKKCGIEITRYSLSGLCPSCSAKASRIVERPSREELKELIRTKSFCEIARQFNVTDNAIRKWCKAVNLPSRKCDIVKIQNWEEI